MQNLRPRIIIEGTDFAGTRDLALALSQHPRIVGKPGNRCFTAIISAKWCNLNQFPWGDKLIDFTSDEVEQAIRNYNTWVSLIELQRHTGWIIDRFHLTTCAYQLLHNQAEYTFDWLEERLQKLGFHQVLLTQNPGSLRAVIESSGQIHQHHLLETRLQEQDLLRRLASNSRLPTMEIDVSEMDTLKTADEIADWIQHQGANIPPDEDGPARGILPPIY